MILVLRITLYSLKNRNEYETYVHVFNTGRPYKHSKKHTDTNTHAHTHAHTQINTQKKWKQALLFKAIH